MASDPSIKRGLIAAISSVSIVGFAMSFMLTLLSLGLESRGAGGVVIGAQSACLALSSIFVSMFAPKILNHFGVRKVIIACICTIAALLPCFPFIDNVWLWLPIRLVNGFCMVNIFVASEFWLTSIAPSARRGLIMGIYTTCLSLGFALGPALLGLVGSRGMTPYLLASFILLCGLIPQFLPSPALPETQKKERRLNSFHVFAAAPIALLAALVFGVIETSNFTFLPIWSVRSGLGEAQSAFLVAVVGFGTILFQIPFGSLADKLNKTAVLLACALIASASFYLIPVFATHQLLLYANLMIYGGASTAIYTISLSMLADKFSGSSLATANAAYMVASHIGTFAVLPMAGFAMEIINPNGFIFLLSGLLFLYATFITIHLKFKKATAS